MALTLGPDPRLQYSPVCKILILLNVLVFVLGMLGDMLGLPILNNRDQLNLFALFPSAVVKEGMFWTPFTYMFLHGGLMHLVFNMMGIYLLGPDLEQTFGRRKFTLLYLLSGWLGGIGFIFISYILQGQLTPCVGASGAIFGLLGGIVALYPKRIYVILPLMIPMRASVLATLLLSTHLFFILTPYGNHVAYDVHLAGGLTGFLFCGGAALLHRYQWRDVIPKPEIPYAAVELETLAYRIAQKEGDEVDAEELKRYETLKKALRFEDVPSVEEIRAQRA
ncbi:rhomboid family intramembrane serine protease [Kiritimatiellaeota bacterium B1221]|nr:rhomboid family intramembrane serine protease [Kiritimatiellaeota bacterium B1221]